MGDSQKKFKGINNESCLQRATNGAHSTQTVSSPSLYIYTLAYHSKPHQLLLPLCLQVFLSLFVSMADPVPSEASKRACHVPERTKLHLAMLALQFGYAGFHVVSRAALNMGISKIVFPVYRNIIALILLAPFAYFLEKYVEINPFFSFSYPFLLLNIQILSPVIFFAGKIGQN